MISLTGFLRKISIFIFSLFLFSFGNYALAQESSSIASNSDVIYTIKNGNLLISLTVKLESNSTYPSVLNHYNLYLPFSEVKSTVITSQGKTVPFAKYSRENFTEIVVSLGDLIIKESSPYTFNAFFEIENFLDTNGRKFVVPIDLAQNLNIKSLQLIYPKSRGKPLYSSLRYSNLDTIGDYFYLSYKDINQIKDDTNALTVIAGDNFTYDFNIEKTYENSDSNQGYIATINIPREHHNQSVIFSEISPMPTSVYIDSADNIFFQYNVNPNQTVNIKISGGIIVEENKTTYKNSNILTAGTGYWEITDPTLTADLPKNSSAEDIYNYLINRLKLAQNNDLNQRIGATEALKQNTDLSIEDIVDTYIAVYRSLGIPARMVFGYVSPNEYGQEGFFHYWLEIYTASTGWLVLDPTLDLLVESKTYYGEKFNDHVSIIVRDQDSISPSFTTTDSANYSIVLSQNGLAKIDYLVASSPNVKYEFWQKDIFANITIKNSGNRIVRSVSTEDERLQIVQNIDNIILPGQEKSITVLVKEKNNFSTFFEVTSGYDQTTTVNTSISVEKMQNSSFAILIKLLSISIFGLILFLIFRKIFSKHQA